MRVYLSLSSPCTLYANKDVLAKIVANLKPMKQVFVYAWARLLLPDQIAGRRSIDEVTTPLYQPDKLGLRNGERKDHSHSF